MLFDLCLHVFYLESHCFHSHEMYYQIAELFVRYEKNVNKFW